MKKISRHKRVIIFLLAFFLGGFGVHRFWVGKIATGLLWFFTFGLFGFGYIYDLIIILIGSFKDKEEAYVIDWI